VRIPLLVRAAATMAAASACLIAPAVATANPDVAALQVALRSRGLYAGPVDGVAGPGTRAGVARFQARNGLIADGVAGPATRAALGRMGRPPLGSRVIAVPGIGWDVAAVQYLAATKGFPSGPIDGGFGPRSRAAIQRFQTFAGLAADGAAGPGTIAALRGPRPVSPLRFLRPVNAPIGDRFGPRGVGMHTGLDFPAATGVPVFAAGRGCVSFAGWDAGGYGQTVAIRHRMGMVSMYAHLSRIDVRTGQCLVGGNRIGAVGSTGHSSGPHLHFELRLRGAAIDPLTGL
jgi:murein DD-endopeptidase MepM/ murein hydrolase activator NlpD